jgi:TPR repeat protein
MMMRTAFGVLCAAVLVPCFAGDLENGIRFHEHKHYAKAAAAFEKSAVRGNAEAPRRLGFMYYQGEGVAQDNGRAVALFEQSAAAGDVISASNLAKMYEFGMGVEQDDARAAAWYEKAANMGDSMSQFNASIMYYKGQGVARDRAEAAKWWTLAMMPGGPLAETIRRSIESAEAKLTPEEVAEGRRRADAWVAAHGAGKR